MNGMPFKTTTITTELSDGLLTYAGEVSGLKGLPQYWLIGLFLPGLVWFGYDCLSYRRTVVAWRGTSRLDESLRQWLPEPLQNLKATIRVVCGSRVAAAT